MRIAYLSLQAVAQGQDTWAAVTEIIAGWEHSSWQVDRWFADYGSPSTPPGALARLREMRRIQTKLGGKLGSYDAVYIRGHMLAYPLARRAQRRGVPVIQECNGTYEDLFIAWPATRVARPIFEHMQRKQYRDADLVVCGTEQQRAWLRAETGHDRIVVSPNGANAELFTPDAPRRPDLPENYVLFFGQFAPWQGVEVLLAAKKRPEWPPGVELVFVGDGERRPIVEAAAAAPGSGISYLGRLPYEELPGVIAHCVASTSPQFTPERGDAGFSALKLYESMACGVPVIGSDYPGVGDVIRRHRCGIAVPPGEAGALAAAVARIAADPDAARAMGARGREAIERECSWAARAEQRRIAIEAVISDSRREGRAKP